MITQEQSKKMKRSFEKHIGEQNVSLDDHVRKCIIKLGESLDERTPIYLDLRFWIILRDVALDRRQDTPGTNLLKILRLLVKGGKAFCPISQSAFVEILKQEDLETRRATATIIDELSLGVTLATEELLIGTELAHYFYSFKRPDYTYPLNWLIWSKLSFVLGVVHPTNTAFDQDQELIIQKSFFDHMWELPLTQVVETLGDTPVPPLEFDAIANKINAGNALHSNEIRSFQQAYVAEISGMLSIHIHTIENILKKLMDENLKVPSSFVQDGKIKESHKILEILVSDFRKTDIALHVPTLHIYASCHAAIRWDKQRKMNGNDLLDLHHAAGALAHCDFFLTEGPLKTLLQANHVALDKLNNCKIISSVIDAVDNLETLQTNY